MNTKTAALLRELTIKVKNGSITTAEAEKLAVLALEEVKETPVEDTPPMEDTEPEAPPVDDTPPVSAVDPKNRLTASLSKFENSIAVAWKSLESEVTSILKETEGAAVPTGDFIVKNTHQQDQESSSKLTVEPAEGSSQIQCIFTLRKTWKLVGIKLPVSAGVSREKACSLPLRLSILSLAESVKDKASSELSWRTSKLPLSEFNQLEASAMEVNDMRAYEVLKSRPSDIYLNSWKKWAVSAQVYLIGSDYSEFKKFEEIL
jgi:hypothetical protein